MHWSVVDQRGQFWEQPGHLLQHSHRSPTVTPDKLDFLVRTPGCVLIRASGDSCVVQAAPHRTRYQTFTTVARLLTDANPRRVSFTWYKNNWQTELLPGAKPALARFLALMHNQGLAERFHLRHRPIDSLERSHPHRLLIDLWRANGGLLGAPNQLEVITNLSRARFLTVHQDPDSAALKFARLGRGWSLYDDRDWMTKCVGQRVEEQPDVAYGSWVAETLRMAMLSAEPQICDIDAIVRDPSTRAEQRIQYTRLTLPITNASGAAETLSTPFVDHRIDLRAHPASLIQ